ncbi:uncharacterized protein LOC127837426 [Dreissena polymorpha]|uniref:uncharacterized protein LOC127837426 n=1 Tax=Dreissena polymorpha TaxID=45954 RepID=UPI002263E812|nr:uncharacterized protein LOC127837426 [Dreissena polymorpha]
MAHYCQPHVVLNSVNKGYHVYKNKMAEEKTYMCVKDFGNVVDKNAILVICTDDSKSIGHVPALPVPLNKAFTTIMDMHPGISIECIASDNPRPSSYPWPDTSAQGGGIIPPVQYKISAPASLTDRIKYILMCAASDEQDILKEMNVHVVYECERTPPMIISKDDGTQDTPNYKLTTP